MTSDDTRKALAIALVAGTLAAGYMVYMHHAHPDLVERINQAEACGVGQTYNATTETCEDVPSRGLLWVFGLLATAVLLLGLVALIFKRYGDPPP